MAYDQRARTPWSPREPISPLRAQLQLQQQMSLSWGRWLLDGLIVPEGKQYYIDAPLPKINVQLQGCGYVLQAPQVGVIVARNNGHA